MHVIVDVIVSKKNLMSYRQIVKLLLVVHFLVLAAAAAVAANELWLKAKGRSKPYADLGW